MKLNMNLNLFFSLLLVMALAGCAQQIQQENSLPSQPESSLFPDSSRQIKPAVSNLLHNTDQLIAAHKWSDALATAERALRIDTRDAAVWSRMAYIHQQQNDPAQAAQMYTRSLSLSGNDDHLKRFNLERLADCYRQLNDTHNLSRVMSQLENMD